MRIAYLTISHSYCVSSRVTEAASRSYGNNVIDASVRLFAVRPSKLIIFVVTENRPILIFHC